MHFIAVSVLAFSILFSNTSYTQDLTTDQKVDTRSVEQDEKVKSDKKVKPDKKVKTEQKEFVFTTLSGESPFPSTTFRSYSTQTNINSGIMEWKNRYQKPQQKYNVSLVEIGRASCRERVCLYV